MRWTCVGSTTCLLAISLALALPVRAQTPQLRWTVEPRASLAWWQVNPHLNHLWATTCPQDPTWRAGEGRTLAWAGEFMAMRSKTGHGNVLDTIIPLFPRRVPRPICTEAVTGEVSAADTVTWRGVRGLIVVKGEHLITGLDMRDRYARTAILKTNSYPDIRFTIDSLSAPQTRGDTLRGRVFGKLNLLNRDHPTDAPLRAWPERNGLRVQTQFMVSATDLIDKFGISKQALGLGAGTLIWRELHMGIDVVLQPSIGSQ